mmetsp:Transcript_20102/g.46853  ORF Transcript_20102/g.46853 Transcript_20102/m.46853 type:complete len:158 (-) Transcript_20102:269-742(-)
MGTTQAGHSSSPIAACFTGCKVTVDRCTPHDGKDGSACLAGRSCSRPWVQPRPCSSGDQLDGYAGEQGSRCDNTHCNSEVIVDPFLFHGSSEYSFSEGSSAEDDMRHVSMWRAYPTGRVAAHGSKARSTAEKAAKEQEVIILGDEPIKALRALQANF